MSNVQIESNFPWEDLNSNQDSGLLRQFRIRSTSLTVTVQVVALFSKGLITSCESLPDFLTRKDGLGLLYSNIKIQLLNYFLHQRLFFLPGLPCSFPL